MKRAVYAIAAAAIVFIVTGARLNATAIVPIAAVTNAAATNPSNVMQVYYYHRHARRHARRCYRSGGAWYYC